MKVLMLNGSPRENGNTAMALSEMEKIFLEEGIEVETVQLGKLDIRGCTACGYCHKEGKCVFPDIVNELARKLESEKKAMTEQVLAKDLALQEQVAAL